MPYGYLMGKSCHHNNGFYTKINNDLLATLYKCPLNGTEIRLILVVIRMTNGWNREARIISYGYLAKEANLDKRNVRRTVNLLVRAGVVVKSKIGRRNMLGINQNHRSWELWKNKKAGGRKYPCPEGDFTP